MNNPLDTRIAADNAALRALDKRTAQRQPQRAPLPDRATIGERLHAHGKDSGVEFRTKLADDFHTVTTTVDKLRRNPTRNAAQIELDVADTVRGRVDRLKAECDDEGKRIDDAESELERTIDDVFRAPRSDWSPLGAELRATLLDMNDEQRLDFIERLQSTRHGALLRFAIASVPPELSGVSLSTHKQMEETMLVIRDPDLLTRPADLRKRRAALKVTVEGIDRTAAELADFDAADAIKELTK